MLAAAAMTDDLNPGELLVIEEAATLLRVTVDAARKMVERGEMPGLVRIGRRVRIRRDDLRRHLGLLPSTKPNIPRASKDAA